MPKRPPSPGGLTAQLVLACALLALLIASAFLFLLDAVRDEAASSRGARRVRAEMATGDELERQFLQLDRQALAFGLTGDPASVVAWDAARATYLSGLGELGSNIQDDRMAAQVGAIAAASEAYLDDVLRPIIRATEHDQSPERIESLMRRATAGSATVLHLFDEYRAGEARLLDERTGGSDDATSRAAIAALLGIAGSVALVGAFVVYLVRRVLQPLRRAATMADRLAGGDLAVRLDADGPGEIGQLERSFNTMGSALEGGRDRLIALADEQAALHRVASLVATSAKPEEVFAAVVAEVDALIDSESTVLLHFDDSGTASMVASRQRIPGGRPIGATWRYEHDELIESFIDPNRPVHAGSIAAARGPTAELLRARGVRSLVGAPITVEDRVWGAVIASWTSEVDDPNERGHKVGEFTELVGAAIANVDSRNELAASRARIVAAADEARRRIERDIHDGAQQRLIALTLDLRLAEMSVPDEAVATRRDLARLGESLSEAVDSLQEIARGIHPAILSHGGLTPAIENLVRRTSVPTTFSSSGERRLDQAVEVAVYYFVSEALTNVARHAEAVSASVEVDVGDDEIRIVVRDDGVGGADPAQGSGLIGLQDRIAAVGGVVDLDSRPGGGTTVTARVPLAPNGRAVDSPAVPETPALSDDPFRT